MCGDYLKVVNSISAKMLVLMFFSSCMGKVSSNSESIVVLEKVDSIRIERGNKVRLLDFNPVKNIYFAYDQVSHEFLLLDNRGKVLETAYLEGDGPDQYNSNLVGASFNRESEGYLLLSSRELIWFNDQWEVANRNKFASHSQINFYTGPRFEVPNYLLPNDSSLYFFTNFFSGVNPYVSDNPDDTTSNYLIEQYNPVINGLKWVFPFDLNQLPEFELGEKDSKIKPVQVYSLDRNERLLYLTFERSNEVGIYDLANDFELKKKLNFNHDSFLLSNKSKNKALFKFGSEILGILYFQGLSESSILARKNENPEYIAPFDPSLYSLIIIKDGLQQGNEIAFPINCEPNSEIIQLPDNRILFRDKYLGDDEPEYSTYSIYELKSRD